MHKILLQQGTESGHYVVPDSLAAGVYQIIVYTNLTRNAGEAFMFRQNIRIMGEQVAESPSPFSVLFYPESGVLLSGVNNRVVARISGEMPPNTTGRLFQNDSLLLELRLDTIAVQTFFVKPSEKSKLDFRISDGQKLPFPAPVQGYTMQVDALNDPNHVVVRLLNNLPQTARKPLRLLAYAADLAIFEAEITPQRNLITIRMSRQELGVEGQIELLLLNETHHVLAARPVYLPHTGIYTSQLQFQNDSLKVQIVSPPQALPFEGRLAVCLRYFDPPAEPQINRYLFIGAFIADVSPSFDLTQPKIIDQLLMATPLPSNLKKTAKALELEAGFVFSGRVSSNHKPLTMPAQLTGFIQNDSAKVLFSGKTNDRGHFTTKPMQFYGKASLVAKATAANNKLLTIDFDKSDPFLPAWREAFVPPLKPLLKSQADVAAFLNKRKSQTLKEVVIKRKKAAPRDIRKPYLFADATIKINHERMGGQRLFEILQGKLGGILVDEDRGVTNLRLRGYMGVFMNGTPSTWHNERYILANEIASIDVLMDPALALGMRGLSVSQWQQAGALLINEGKSIFITFLSAQAVINGQLTLGGMLAVQYIIGQVNSPIEQLIGLLQSGQDAKISLERLNEVYELEEEEQPEATRKLPSKKHIYFKNVTFTYRGAGNEPIFQDLNLFIPEGKVTAIVGTSGSGKTTLLKLLLRFYDPIQGQIRVGDTPLA